MSDQMLNQVRQVVADVLGVPLEDVNADTSYQTVAAWDSLNIIKLVMAIESEFQVPISADDAVNFTSVSAIVRVLEEKKVR
jgi:acyl carrier protein